MKYGQTFEKASVPAWKVYNLDYNSLKELIKVNTTKNQATAITIPGKQDTALNRFEDELYLELCRQHERVGLFVNTKADEIGRRLQHLSNQVHSLILRCTTSSRTRMSVKRQRRFAKYESEAARLGDEIRDLSRFVDAQVVGFHKILKKYRKWTGSSTLSSRFKDNVLSNPKSFTKRDFSHMEAQCDELLATIREASPIESVISTPVEQPATPSRRRSAQLSSAPAVTFAPLPPPTPYWNEYDDGSEAGDADGGYAIYVNPDEESPFFTFISAPISKVKAWMAGHRSSEHEPLLPTSNGYGTAGGGGIGSATESLAETATSPTSPTIGHTTEGDEDDEDDAFASDVEFFPHGYEAHYASLPSINEQRVARFREKALFRGMLACYAASAVLLAVAAVLVTTGRHRLRVEVDAGVAVGVVASLCAACAALGMSVARHDRVGLLHRLAVWATFAALCVLNGMVLVLVMGNTAL